VRAEAADRARLQEIGRRGHQRSSGSRERAGEAVAGEGARAIVVGNAAGQHCVLDRDQNARVAGLRIDGADEGHDQHERDVRHLRERNAGRHHQGGAKQQHGAQVMPRRQEACHQRQQRRTEQGRGCHDSDLGRAKADRRQIGRQDDDRKTIGEAAHAARRVEQKHFGANGWGRGRHVSRAIARRAGKAQCLGDMPSTGRLRSSPTCLRCGKPGF
jgi:hypothetical protein